jgi:hypothetical protein
MGFIAILIVLGSSIWVLADASAIGIKKGQVRGLANMSAGDWFACCLLLWIVVFPFYLSMRPKFMEINGKTKGLLVRSNTLSADGAAALEKLAGLRDKGIVTEAEFQEQKAKILGQAVPPPSARAETVACPLCKTPIELAILTNGANRCPGCAGVFNVEG